MSADLVERARAKFAAGQWSGDFSPSSLRRQDGLSAQWIPGQNLLQDGPFTWEIARLGRHIRGRLVVQEAVGRITADSWAEVVELVDEGWPMPPWWLNAPGRGELPVCACAVTGLWSLWRNDEIGRADAVRLTVERGVMGPRSTWLWTVMIPEKFGDESRCVGIARVGPCDAPTAMASVDAALPMAEFWWLPGVV